MYLMPTVVMLNMTRAHEHRNSTPAGCDVPCHILEAVWTVQIRVDGYLKQNIWLSKDAVRVSKLLVNATAIAVVKDRKVWHP